MNWSHELANTVAMTSGWLLECSPRQKQQAATLNKVEFVVQGWRWLVERTFDWLNWWRRLAKDCERKVLNSETMVQLEMNRVSLRWLARLQASQANP